MAGAMLTACSSPTPEGSRPAPSPPQQAPSIEDTPGAATGSSGPTQVPSELRFTSPALGGGTIDGADYAGNDLVMWFWAPW